MPEVQCKCGNIIKTGEIPNSNEWLFISDVEYDNYTENIDVEDLYLAMKRFLVCNQCERIWIYWEGNQKTPVSYIRDEIS
jgi:hypothetical protein